MSDLLTLLSSGEAMAVLFLSDVTSIVALILCKNGKIIQTNKDGKLTYVGEEILSTQKERKLLTFLNNADEAYMAALGIGDISPLSRYVNKDVCKFVKEKIGDSRHQKSFGVKKYRIRIWELLNIKNGIYYLRKTMNFKNVKLRRGLEIPIAEPIIEDWVVEEVRTNVDGFKITDIIELEVNF